MAQLLLTGTALSSGSSLDQALRWLEVRLDGWASNADAYNALLLQVFGVQGSDATSSLLTSLSGSGLGISLEILDGTTLSGIDGAYTGEAPSGGERIYLKAAWLRSATAAQIEAVLLEELGHAIDTRLKGGVDTCGDEGEIFSALLRGTTPDNAAFSENDQRLININGKDVAIEASDTTAPTGSFGNYATAPAYAAPTTNPFRISTVGNLARPAFADADADGDLDLFIGNYNGNTLFFRNTAAPGATAPVYARANTNPFGISTVGSFASPAFADADGDGDLDLFIGNYDGNTLFFRNTAAPGATAPAYAPATTNPFGISSVGLSASPAFADADADGDLDLFIGNSNGNTLFFRNTAAPGATAPAYAPAITNPFGISSVDDAASPAFADADADGDLDLFIGELYGNTVYFRNTAASGATAPAYAPATINPFGISAVGFNARPAFADADADGDLDLFIGNNSGDTVFFRNTAATPVAPVSSSNANGSYGIGAVITLTVQFSEAVVVITTGGIPTLKLETGVIDDVARFVSGSGTNTLSFTYNVGVSHFSRDLDQLSANALTLNGGTIRDTAGNNAILTLAAPGATASLGANKALVIDGFTLYTTIENQGNTKLLRGGNGIAFVETGAGRRQEITVPWGVSATVSDNNEWEMLAADTITGVNQALWRNNSTSFLYIWNLDANWNLQSTSGAYGFNTPKAWELETSFQVDGNRDGIIGAPFTTLEAQGNTKLLRRGDGLAFVETGAGRRQETTAPWGVSATGSDNNEWEMLAAEKIGDTNQVLWRNNTASFLHIWNLDSNWSLQSTSGAYGFNTPNAWELETSFQVDGNRDGIIGAPFTTLEAQGNTKLLRRGDGLAFVETGAGRRQETTAPWGVSATGSDNNEWEMLAAEKIGDTNQVLWRNNTASFLHIWNLDSNWSLQSTSGAYGFNTPNAWELETSFQVDGNRDGIIGAPLILL